MFYSLQYMEEPTVTFNRFFPFTQQTNAHDQILQFISPNISMLPYFEAEIFQPIYLNTYLILHAVFIRIL